MPPAFAPWEGIHEVSHSLETLPSHCARWQEGTLALWASGSSIRWEHLHPTLWVLKGDREVLKASWPMHAGVRWMTCETRSSYKKWGVCTVDLLTQNSPTSCPKPPLPVYSRACGSQTSYLSSPAVPRMTILVFVSWHFTAVLPVTCHNDGVGSLDHGNEKY
jgi:hypothetical protein